MVSTVSRPAALALLACCLVFGILLGLTGVANDSNTTAVAPSSTLTETRTQGLRSVDHWAVRSLAEQERLGQRKAALLEEGALLKRATLDQDALQFLTWPGEEEEKQAKTTKGLWGPNDEERDELALSGAEDAGDGLAWHRRDGGNTEALFGSDINNGIEEDWDRLILEMDGYFSFSFEL